MSKKQFEGPFKAWKGDVTGTWIIRSKDFQIQIPVGNRKDAIRSSNQLNTFFKMPAPPAKKEWSALLKMLILFPIFMINTCMVLFALWMSWENQAFHLHRELDYGFVTWIFIPAQIWYLWIILKHWLKLEN